MKYKTCPMCSGDTYIKLQDYYSDYCSPTTGHEIVVKNVKIVQCLDEDCSFLYLPIEEERRIDDEVALRSTEGEENETDSK